MRSMNRKGFTLIELLVAMMLMGIVALAIYNALVMNQRVYRQQSERIDLDQNLRSGISFLPSDLRELDPGDPAGSDIQTMTAGSITYKAPRSLYALCQAPNTVALQITLA